MKIEILATIAGLLVVNALKSRNTCDQGWVDANGNGCKEYEREKLCKNDGDHYGKGWKAEWGTFDNLTDSEHRTALVCPFCGCKEGRIGNFLWEVPLLMGKIKIKNYTWYSKHTTYDKARSFCRELGGDLPIVSTKKEMISLAYRMPPPGLGRNAAWVGGRKIDGDYIWTKSKEPIAKNLWADSKPSDGEECVMVNQLMGLPRTAEDGYLESPKLGQALYTCSCGFDCTAFIICQNNTIPLTDAKNMGEYFPNL